MKFSDLVYFVSTKDVYPVLPESNVLQPLQGSEDKYYCTWEGERWILKDSLFDKRRKEWALFPYCEHVGSAFFNAVGVHAQTTKLVSYKNRTAVICKDFAVDSVLREFKELHQSSVGTDLSDKDYTYDEVIYVLEHIYNLKDNDLSSTVIMFWRMFIVDAILGNRDRHEGNWGFLIKNKKASFSPIYDNGASLFPNVNLYNFSEDFVRERVYKMPVSQFKAWRDDVPDRAMRTNFYEIITGFDNPVLKTEIYNFTNLDIVEIIKNVTSGIPGMVSLWFSVIIYCRYNCILLARDFHSVYCEAMSIFVRER